MTNKLKKHSKDIEKDLTQALTAFFNKSNQKQPTSFSLKMESKASGKTTIRINIKD